MDKILELANQLKFELDKLPLFIEFKKVDTEIKNSQELDELKKRIVLAKKENNLAIHQTLLEQYNNHPLMVNYHYLKDEVYDYLKELSEIINKK